MKLGLWLGAALLVTSALPAYAAGADPTLKQPRGTTMSLRFVGLSSACTMGPCVYQVMDE